MLNQVRRRLALLYGSIILSLLVVLSVCYLAISEKNLKDNSFSSFQSDMNTLLSSLETQTVFTHDWLAKMEGNGKYLISITDNGRDFLWGNQRENPERREKARAGWDYYERTYEIEAKGRLATYHTEFSFPSTGSGRDDYYGCAAISNRADGTLAILILKPLDTLREQILHQRCIFLLLVLTAGALLCLFSWYFTGRLLLPVEISRQSQLAFVAAASHELRTPLAVLLSAAGACRRAHGAERDKFFDIMEEEGAVMSRLISDLLLLAGADSSFLPLQTESCEPDTLLLTAFEAFEPLAKEKGYFLSVKLPEQSMRPFPCDSGRIRQLLSILIHNAFSYTPAGSHIRMELRQDDRRTLFLVIDDGPGIPADMKSHIFERFYRGSRERQTDGHFGLGLSIAAQIMESHHGEIAVTDTPGGGATFTLSFPTQGA